MTVGSRSEVAELAETVELLDNVPAARAAAAAAFELEIVPCCTASLGMIPILDPPAAVARSGIDIDPMLGRLDSPPPPALP